MKIFSKVGPFLFGTTFFCFIRFHCSMKKAEETILKLSPLLYICVFNSPYPRIQ